MIKVPVWSVHEEIWLVMCLQACSSYYNWGGNLHNIGMHDKLVPYHILSNRRVILNCSTIIYMRIILKILYIYSQYNVVMPKLTLCIRFAKEKIVQMGLPYCIIGEAPNIKLCYCEGSEQVGLFREHNIFLTEFQTYCQNSFPHIFQECRPCFPSSQL